MKKRRQRSNMSHTDCVRAVETFARRIQRMGTTDAPGMFSTLPDDQINVQIAVLGNFGVAGDFFEALRVMSGAKLPARATSTVPAVQGAK